MLRQYARTGACRFRREMIRGCERMVGVIPIGTIIYIQDNVRPMRGLTHCPVLREPWIVDAWVGRYGMRHCAVVRSLRTGRVQEVADWILLYCVDSDLDCQKESWNGHCRSGMAGVYGNELARSYRRRGVRRGAASRNE